MLKASQIRESLKKVFKEDQAEVLSEVISASYDELVKISDFSELKGIVKELVEIQKGSEQRLTRLEIVVEELAEAQKRTEERVEELAEAQKRTEIEIQKLARGLNRTREDLGGLSRSMGYAFENEAYRMLPVVLKERFGIEVKERLIRTEIGNKEINILGRAKKDGRDVLIVGEVKLRLDEKKKELVFKELEDKVLAIKEEYKEDVVKVLITHFATKGFLKKAEKEGIIVVQSFEW